MKLNFRCIEGRFSFIWSRIWYCFTNRKTLSTWTLALDRSALAADSVCVNCFLPLFIGGQDMYTLKEKYCTIAYIMILYHIIYVIQISYFELNTLMHINTILCGTSDCRHRSNLRFQLNYPICLPVLRTRCAFSASLIQHENSTPTVEFVALSGLMRKSVPTDPRIPIQVMLQILQVHV